MPLKKKPPGLMGDLKKFMDDTGITEELKVHGADIIKGGIRMAREALEAEFKPSLPPPPQEFYFTTGAQPQPTPEPEDSNDPYVVLKVARNAETEDIEAVYRRRALRQHPDKGGDPAEFIRTNDAWQKIKNLRGVG